MASWNKSGGDWMEIKASSFQANGVNAFENSLVEVVDNVIDKTPVGLEGGTLKSNWQIAGKVNNRVLKAKAGAATKSGFASKKIKGKTATLRPGKLSRFKNKVLHFFNNSPYAGVVEFGGYPDPVKLGTWNKRKGSYEIRSARGFSKQAPVGMFRLSLIGFNRKVKRRL